MNTPRAMIATPDSVGWFAELQTIGEILENMFGRRTVARRIGSARGLNAVGPTPLEGGGGPPRS